MSLEGLGSTLFAFVLLLGILIFFHELGHFLVAKACGVRVLKFSLGFGPPVGFGPYRLRWVRGHTEYVIAWFPLGGFVKMLGENPDEAEDAEIRAHPSETLNAKPAWQRLAIITAGPAMNLLLPVLVFAATLMLGMPRAAPVVGSVEVGSPAALAGLQPGDRVLSIDGREVAWWTELEDAVREGPEQSLALEVERDGAVVPARLEVASRSGFDALGELTSLGWSGLLHSRPRAILGVPAEASPAWRAGLRSGDHVLAVDGQDVEDWYDLGRLYAAAEGSAALRIERGASAEGETLELEAPALATLDALGVVQARVLVGVVEADAPAERADIRPGDLVLAVDGEAVSSFSSFADTVTTSGGRTLALEIAREGRTRIVEVAPEPLPTDVSGLGVEEDRYRIGVRPFPGLAPTLPGASALDREPNPAAALARGTRMTADATVAIARAFARLFSLQGEVHKQIAGPIGIAQIAGEAFRRGWETYLWILVMISINLAIVNLLPVPVLDGGQALIVIIEAVKRSPLSQRTREFVAQVGITFIVLLLGLAFWNDLSRSWSSILDWFRS